jgi:hypothetical protein
LLLGRITFRLLAKGSQGRKRILRAAANLPNKRFYDELKGINRDPLYHGGYTKEYQQAMVLSRKGCIVAKWSDMVRGGHQIDPGLARRAQSISEELRRRKNSQNQVGVGVCGKPSKRKAKTGKQGSPPKRKARRRK